MSDQPGSIKRYVSVDGARIGWYAISGHLVLGQAESELLWDPIIAVKEPDWSRASLHSADQWVAAMWRAYRIGRNEERLLRELSA